MAIVKIEVDLENQEAFQGIRKINTELERMPQTGRQASDGFRRLTGEQRQASQAAQLLASRLGISLPQSVRTFIVGLRGIAPALAAAFNASAIIAIGLALFEAGKGLYNWIAGTKEAEESTKKLKEEQERLNRVLNEYEDFLKRIERLKQEGRTLGLTGSAKTSSDLEYLQRQFEIAKAEYAALLAKQNRLEMAAQEYVIRGGRKEPTKEALEALKEYDELQDALEEKRQAYGELKIQLENKIRALGLERSEEAKKIFDEEARRLKELLEKVDAYRAATEKLSIANIPSPITRLGVQRVADIEAARQPGIPEEDIAARVSEINKKYIADMIALGQQQLKGIQDVTKYREIDNAALLAEVAAYDKAKAATDQLTKSNEDLVKQILRRQGNIAAVTQMELDALEKQKQLYADNAEAIAALEERKKLVIMNVNLEIAEDAKAKFERTAQSIEGFFQRVFLTARSFSDIWRQLWTQSVGWVISQFSRMVAGWLSAHRQMAQSSGMGGVVMGGGATGMGLIGQGISTLMPGGIFNPGTSSSVAAAAAGASTAPGGSAGYSLDQLLYGTAGGAGGGGVSGNPLLAPGGGLSTFGLVTSVGALGGLALAQYGIKTGSPLAGGIGGFFGGGFAGLGIGASLIASGHFLAGALAGPVGAGIGLALGLIFSFRKRGQLKKASASIHEEYLSVAKKALEDFKAHRETYDSAIGMLTSVYQQAVGQLQGMGGPGRDTITQITANYNSVMAQMDEVNKARGLRSAIRAGLSAPEFQTGSMGIIPGSGPMAAIIHGGEAVLNQEAAAKLGSERIRAMNQGSSAGSRVDVHIHTQDAQGMERVLKNNEATFIKFLRRAAKDRGLPSPI